MFVEIPLGYDINNKDKKYVHLRKVFMGTIYLEQEVNRIFKENGMCKEKEFFFAIYVDDGK